jgi:hypothetical protein
MGLSPRLHNVISYGVCLLIFIKRFSLAMDMPVWLMVYPGATLWCVHFFRR